MSLTCCWYDGIGVASVNMMTAISDGSILSCYLSYSDLAGKLNCYVIYKRWTHQ
jgi:hypothetical protein